MKLQTFKPNKHVHLTWLWSRDSVGDQKPGARKLKLRINSHSHKVKINALTFDISTLLSLASCWTNISARRATIFSHSLRYNCIASADFSSIPAKWTLLYLSQVAHDWICALPPSWWKVILPRITEKGNVPRTLPRICSFATDSMRLQLTGPARLSRAFRLSFMVKVAHSKLTVVRLLQCCIDQI